MAEMMLRRRADVDPRPVSESFAALTQVSRWPRIYVVDQFVDATECRDLAGVGRLVAANGGEPQHGPTGWSIEVPWSCSATTASLAARMQVVLGFECSRSHTLRFRSYRPGESHPKHADHFEIADDWLIATAMLCVEAGHGGATVFPDACPPIAVPPSCGRLTVWFNHVRTGQPDPLSAHFAAPVVEGIKTTLTLFAYADPARCEALSAGLTEGR
jgi:hypothetical protein